MTTNLGGIIHSGGEVMYDKSKGARVNCAEGYEGTAQGGGGGGDGEDGGG